jgi:hypothetical protein
MICTWDISFTSLTKIVNYVCIYIAEQGWVMLKGMGDAEQ